VIAKPGTPLVATGSQTVGPFFHFGLTTDARQGQMAGPQTPGERLQLRVEVLDGAGSPVPDAMVELWQADAEGRDVTAPDHRDPSPGASFLGWGRLPTGEDGTCVFRTVRPGRMPDGAGALQAAHINVCLFMRGLLRQIHTRIYFAGDPAQAQDVVLGMVPADRRGTLLAQPDADGTWTFVIRLQGAEETVFFDV
jgi:protocatechuate 3,4-dioxygenase alpha subunit